MWTFFFAKPVARSPRKRFSCAPSPAPADLQAAPDRSLYRLGHSTILMKLRGRFLADRPVFSKRASPVQWARPRALSRPISIESLPPIAGVIYRTTTTTTWTAPPSTKKLAARPPFITPLGVGDQLIAWGVDPARVEQLDWWQSTDATARS